MSAKTIFEYDRFLTDVLLKIDDYRQAAPYPFAVFDGYFDASILDKVNDEISRSDFRLDERNIVGEEVKIRSDFEDNESLPPAISQVFSVLNGGRFLNIISELTGIHGLISDPYFDGGGVNIIKNNGTLAVHIDGTTQHRMSLCRRINAILFLNDNWDESWSGYHEQWEFLYPELSPFDEQQEWRCVRKILPKKNRLYVFTTNDHSWHGHAGLLKVPDEVERRSLIAYYYTATRPESDVIYDAPHRALFINNDKTQKNEAYTNVEVIL